VIARRVVLLVSVLVLAAMLVSCGSGLMPGVRHHEALGSATLAGVGAVLVALGIVLGVRGAGEGARRGVGVLRTRDAGRGLPFAALGLLVLLGLGATCQATGAAGRPTHAALGGLATGLVPGSVLLAGLAWSGGRRS
jgi:hypothetical protein